MNSMVVNIYAQYGRVYMNIMVEIERKERGGWERGKKGLCCLLCGEEEWRGEAVMLVISIPS